ncbi:PhrK family phosphatase-inhibitory pheromone [Bacillus atrophaeus]|uniref:PhrK family phosphatase-inhibitory pheromone n=1 Tax=Bacillus atrophaeus TaxID=1452 RepID=UPI002E216CD2|nr:PhrK family phosphatase-inhibitory pheromone [Bacillus atrophaeus]
MILCAAITAAGLSGLAAVSNSYTASSGVQVTEKPVGTYMLLAEKPVGTSMKPNEGFFIIGKIINRLKI